MIENDHTKFHVMYNPAYHEYDMYIMKQLLNGEKQITTPACFYTAPVGQVTSPHMRFNKGEAQNLLNALWDAGIRPIVESTTGQIAAISYHLEDMRKLAFSNYDKSCT